jgi:hypothetical protein
VCLQLHDNKKSLIDDGQENLHGGEEIQVVLEIQIFEAHEIFSRKKLVSSIIGSIHI